MLFKIKDGDKKSGHPNKINILIELLAKVSKKAAIEKFITENPITETQHLYKLKTEKLGVTRIYYKRKDSCL